MNSGRGVGGIGFESLLLKVTLSSDETRARAEAAHGSILEAFYARSFATYYKHDLVRCELGS
jgi:hypothetical protein